MAKTNTTKILEAVIFEYFFLTKSMRCALEVDIAHAMKRIDFCAYNKDDEFTGVEIKVSISDFKSQNGHNFVFHRNYYATTIEVYEKVSHLIPSHIGVYVLGKEKTTVQEAKKYGVKEKYCLKLVKKCKKVDMKTDIGKVKQNIITALNSTVRRLTSDLKYIETMIK